MPIPKYDGFFEPLLAVMHQLGGSASVAEQEDAVASLLNLSPKEISEVHSGNRTKVSYRLAWARTYLKRFGILENSARGIWSLTPLGSKTHAIDKDEVKRAVQALDEKTKKAAPDTSNDPSVSESWDSRLLGIVKTIKFDAFERLCKRLLRESGFVQVEVTGRSGDEGIDGKGVVRVGGILSFHVVFQCKRYKGSVGAPVIRDFRGAMVGRADKGVLITTGSFTKDARIEAQRAGAPPIDLIDGEDLVEKLKDLQIGVETRQRIVEEFVIQEDYFQSL
jgi:restriction system protein